MRKWHNILAQIIGAILVTNWPLTLIRALPFILAMHLHLINS